MFKLLLQLFGFLSAKPVHYIYYLIVGVILKQNFVVCILLLSTLVMSGCATQGAKNNIANLLLAEPEPVNPRSQMAIARYNHILTQAPLKNDERAELLFQRGMLYDSMGLSGLARYDYSQALELKPDMAEAYNSIGIHHIQQMDFSQAYEAFDSTLDIDPEYNFAILNRGIALYYGGRAELAVEDIDTFYQIDPKDPYRALWFYIIKHDVDPQLALQTLKSVYPKLDSDNWATTIVEFYMGNATEADVVARLLHEVNNQKQLNDRLCEAYFYLGKFSSLNGQKAKAANYFKLALSTNVYEYVEHRYARLELSRLRRINATN